MRIPVMFVYLLGLLAAPVSFTPPLAHETRFGGTFIGAVIAEDGIIMGSDSRSTFLDEGGRSMGYVDGMQKIYVSNSTGVAVSGLTSVDGELFSSFADRNSFLLQRTPDEVLFGFSAWLPFRNSTGVLLLSGGYKDGKPMICARSVFRPQSCQDTGSITNKPSKSLDAWVSALRAAPKASAAAEVLGRAIAESATSDVTVGGGISMVQMRAGAPPVWLSNPPRSTGWKSVCDLVRDYRAGRSRIVPTGSQSELDRYLASSCQK